MPSKIISQSDIEQLTEFEFDAAAVNTAGDEQLQYEQKPMT